MESVEPNRGCEASGKLGKAISPIRCARDGEAKAKVISLRSFTTLLEQRGLIPRMLTSKQVDTLQPLASAS